MKNRLIIWIIIFLSMTVYGMRVGSTALISGALLAASLIFIAYQWNHFSLAKLSIDIDFTDKKIFAGEETEFNLSLTNAKILPVFWLTVHFNFRKGMNLIGGEKTGTLSGNRNIFFDKFNLSLYQKLNRHYQVMPEERGAYYLGNGMLETEGFIGLFSQKESLNNSLELVVYPQIYPVDDQVITRLFARGEKMTDGWIMVDPINRAGVRDYQPSDQRKQINWKVSARHQQLKSDIYHPSKAGEIEIILDIRSADKSWEGIDKDQLEIAYSLAGSLARQFLNKGIEVGFLSNGKPKIGEGSRVEPGNHPGQLEEILTALAYLKPLFRRPIAEYAHKLQQGADKLIITTYPEGLELNRYFSNKGQGKTWQIILGEPDRTKESGNLQLPGWSASLAGGEGDQEFKFKPL
ncbi:DUF58 domain-containing protein [Halanaerobiaceae bacterium Z-7014]|uniref:DUF58 domain-containing protein n=1 Tax=Halonatronomonas betaini TaxID=2778430 RepID=A0A931AXN3_9FIRM|nr:DUF58 domain-containing protein [Halonatronomonas betaini]